MHNVSRGFLNVELMCIIGAHATYIDFSLGKAEYRLVAVFGPSGPKRQGDNATVFSERKIDDIISNTKKNMIAVGDWNVGIFRTEYSNQIIARIEDFDLIDIFTSGRGTQIQMSLVSKSTRPGIARIMLRKLQG